MPVAYASVMDTIIFPLTSWAERNSALLLTSIAGLGVMGLALFGSV